MFITKQNKILYDTKNFDLSKNVYTVLLDKTKVKANIDSIDNYDILNINIHQDIVWLFFPELDTSNFKNEWKIIYGHFYNNSDIFIYKDIHSGKIIGHSIKKTYIEKLYYNKNKLLYSKSYKTLVDQLNKLQSKNKETYKDEYQPTIDYIYEQEEIFFNDPTKYLIADYDDECLTIIYTNKTIITQN